MFKSQAGAPSTKARGDAAEARALAWLQARGLTLVERGDAQGIALLDEAYEILPHPHGIYNIARAYAELGLYRESIDALPARFSFLSNLWLKFSSGEFGKIRPPPRHNGEEDIPARARPVPFCRNGFAVVCRTCSRSFCARFPLRAFAW